MAHCTTVSQSLKKWRHLVASHIYTPQTLETRNNEANKKTSEQSDHESDVCDDPTCKKYFNYFVRRHHCRRCGNIFCDSHSSYEVPLDESANYNPRGQLSRSCAHCYGDFKMWRGRNGSGSSSASTTSERTPQQGSQTVPASPISASPMPGASPTAPGKSQPEVALSVPSDWNWSTF